MCGIVGYIGDKQAQPILLNALGKLEYRGYDSCGVAISSHAGIEVFKDAVRVSVLAKKLAAHNGKTGIRAGQPTANRPGRTPIPTWIAPARSP
jgi:glucosamine--fructose-6-phosphate aminotransferase (isomerizing)